MPEIVNELIGAESYAQIDKLNEKLATLVKNFEDAARASLLIEQAMGNAKGVTETKKNLDELTVTTKKVDDISKQVIATTEERTKAVKNYINAITEQQKAELKEQQEARAWAAQQKTQSNERIKVTQAETVTIQKLRHEIKALRAERDKLDLSTQAGVLRAKELNEGIKENSKLILKNSDEIQKQSANVGNYAGAVSGALNKVWGGIRKIAYIIPGLGIAGIFELAFEAILPLIDKLDLFDAKAKILNETLLEGAKNAAAEVNSLERLYKATQDTTKSHEERIKSVDKLQKMYPDYFGNIKDEIFLNGGAKDSYDKLTKSIIATAKAKSIESRITEIINKDLDKELELQKKLEDAKRVEATKKGQGMSYAGQYGQGGAIGRMTPEEADSYRKAQTSNAEMELRIFKKSQDDKLKVLTDALGKEETIINRNGSVINPLNNTKTPTPKSGKSSRSSSSKTPKEFVYEFQDLDRTIEQMNQAADEKMMERVRKSAEEKYKNNLKYAKMELDLIKENLDAQERMLAEEDRMNQEAFKKKMDRLQSYAELTQGFAQIISTIADSQYDKEIAKIEARDKALEDSYNKELKQIEKSGKSAKQIEEEKLALEARTEAQRKANDISRIQAQRKKAKADKEADIASILSGTAVAVVAALGAKPYTPLNIASAAIVGGIGLANLERAISAPLPQYAEGTEDSGAEGLAIVGERGTELGVTKDGKMFLTPNQATVMNLPAHTKIINHEELIEVAKNKALQNIIASGQRMTSEAYGNELIRAYEENTNELKGLRKDLRDKKMSTTFYGMGKFQEYITKKVH